MKNALIIGSAAIGLAAAPAWAWAQSGGHHGMAHTPMHQSAPKPGAHYNGGAGSPSSTAASNITAADSRSEVAPRLPDPGVATNSPDALLKSAQRALSQGRTGAAQQALEMAETRALTRSVEPSMAGKPDDGTLVQQIATARRALGARDMGAAKNAISMALNAPVPPPGRAVTTRPAAMD